MTPEHNRDSRSRPRRGASGDRTLASDRESQRTGRRGARSPASSRRRAVSIALLCLLLLPLSRKIGAEERAPGLSIESAGPVGPIAKREQAKEIRVVFSEPMIELGRIPANVVAPYFSMTPKVAGSFRWSGTKTLLFTPAAALSWNTEYRVTISLDAASIGGHRLEAPYTFSFRTPGLRLLRTSWYRKADRFDSPVVLVLRFNQPAAAGSLAKRIRVRYAPHPWEAPKPGAGAARWNSTDPQGYAAYEAKIARAKELAAKTDDVAILPARSWNRKWFPASAETAVFETTVLPPPGTWLEVRSGDTDRVVLALEPLLFVDGMRCEAECDPDDANPIQFRMRMKEDALRAAVHVTDVTDGKEKAVARRKKPKPAAGADEGEGEGDAEGDIASGLYPKSQEEWENRPEAWTGATSLDDAGWSLQPGHTYAVRLDPTLRSADGQTLGYSWVGVIENWHRTAFTSFGGGHGVWEASGGMQIPFHARNLRSVRQWVALVKPGDLLGTITRLEKESFRLAPPGAPAQRKLAPVTDQLQSYGLNLEPLLSPARTGIAWTALQNGEPIAHSHVNPDGATPSSSLIQVTNLGISVKDSPDNTLIFVTRLDDAAPVAGATVTIRTPEKPEFWTGTTDAEGIAVAPTTPLRNPENWWEFKFIVTAEKDGDAAYVGSNWNQGSDPWSFGLGFQLEEALPLLRGSVFTDRGVYRLGEEIHFKAVVRSDTAHGIRILPPGTPVEITLNDSQGAPADKRRVMLSSWGTAEWTWKLPAEAPFGTWSIEATTAGQKRSASGSFLVAAFRRPDFRVDAEVAAAGDAAVAGAKARGTVTARYLFGAPMADLPVRWTWSRRPLSTVPRAIEEAFPEDRWEFLGEERKQRRDLESIETKEQKLDSAGQVKLELPTRADSPRPWEYVLEGEVTDVSRQRIAGRASIRVEPASWYIGVRRLPYFAQAGGSVETAIVAADLAGKAAPGIKVVVSLKQVQWHAVRRAEGRGFYTWESERKEIDAGRFEVTTRDGETPLSIPVPRGGFYVVRATAADGQGRRAETNAAFYALGGGYTAWERYDHNRIDLIPEKKTYRPGDTARILVKSPWEKATALLTVEREGIRSHRTFALTSTQQTVTVPIDESAIPNVYVSVLLLKGRSSAYDGRDATDPGKPAFRLGYAELKVEDAAKRLSVAVAADRDQYRPGDSAHVGVTVADAKGAGAPSEVTLWAVDYGILSLTGYRTPDLIGSIYVPKALAVLNEDSRQNIVSRRAIIPKGGAEGGGGGAEEGPGAIVRKDFRVLAFWLGSVVTDADGKASADVKLPESLTTYRIMAVAGDQASRFGRGEKEIVVRKPLLLRAAFPRFLAAGDEASFGAVVHSELKEKGSAVVTMKSLDPKYLEIPGDGKQTVEIGPNTSPEVRFAVRAKAPGTARVSMSVRFGNESDAFEEKIPVELPVSPEAVAASGRTTETSTESLAVPAGVRPDFGGLRVELASTALVNLSEGARYLIDYPYGCAEQRSSAALALLLAADLGRAFQVPGIDADKASEVARATVAELASFQCPDGAFAFWKGDCSSASPYLTSWVLSVLQRAKKLGVPVPDAELELAYKSLEKALGEKPPVNESWLPAHTAWQAFSVKVLAEGGRVADSPTARLFGSLDRMPVFALAYLWDAVVAQGDKGPRAADLRRRIENAILPEGATAHVEESNDPYLLWYWSSNVRTTAIVLGSLARNAPDSPHIPGMVRWLLEARRKGRWGNTQENATAMGALVDYYRKLESEVPAFRATASLGGKVLATERFEGRTSEARVRETPMRDLPAATSAGPLPLQFSKEGTGTLFWSARLTYAPAERDLPSLDSGFRVERTYSPGESAAGAPPPAPGSRFAAGALVKVTLTVTVPKERRFVAVTDPVPAGFEPVEQWFSTTASDLVQRQAKSESGGDWTSWWRRGGFDRVERHDDRILLFATRLAEGTHTFTYLVRATTAGTFQTAPARAEEMYHPEVFGRTANAAIEVGK